MKSWRGLGEKWRGIAGLSRDFALADALAPPSAKPCDAARGRARAEGRAIRATRKTCLWSRHARYQAAEIRYADNAHMHFHEEMRIDPGSIRQPENRDPRRRAAGLRRPVSIDIAAYMSPHWRRLHAGDAKCISPIGT